MIDSFFEGVKVRYLYLSFRASINGPPRLKFSNPEPPTPVLTPSGLSIILVRGCKIVCRELLGGHREVG